MIQIIGLLIAVYTFVRLLTFALRTGERAESQAVRILSFTAAAITVLLTVALLIQKSPSF